MAKNFGKANSAKVIQEVAKASNEKANVIQVKMIGNENLLDFSKNHEDLSDTADLENSMKELGFTDPLEVTGFGLEEGKYTIVSGHRRRVAGVNIGMEVFPCIIKVFANENDIRNYVLLSNAQRDTAKDPLLFCKRFKMHEEYLKESGFKGSVREEIAKRLGISSQQADRYNQFNKIILPVWDMVRDEIVGMSSVIPMATHSVEEQEEILSLLNECIDKGGKLTREVCDRIIKGYRDGKNTYEDIIKANEKAEPVLRDSGLPLKTFINTEPTETKESDHNRNDEIRREYNPYDSSNAKDDLYIDEKLTNEDYETIEAVSKSNDTVDKGAGEEENSEKSKKLPLTENEKKEKRGLDIKKHLEGLENNLNLLYSFSDKETAESTMRTMCNVAKIMFDELYTLGEEYKKESVFKEIINDLKKSIQQFD